jgi:hypothetical protein
VPPHPKRTARTTSQNMTVITTLYSRFLNPTQTANTKPDVALAWKMRRKIRREALDPRSSFRDGVLKDKMAIRDSRGGRLAALPIAAAGMPDSQRLMEHQITLQGKFGGNEAAGSYV